jgi:hypothetical protein
MLITASSLPARIDSVDFLPDIPQQEQFPPKPPSFTAFGMAAPLT